MITDVLLAFNAGSRLPQHNSTAELPDIQTRLKATVSGWLSRVRTDSAGTERATMKILIRKKSLPQNPCRNWTLPATDSSWVLMSLWPHTELKAAVSQCLHPRHKNCLLAISDWSPFEQHGWSFFPHNINIYWGKKSQQSENILYRVLSYPRVIHISTYLKTT